MKPILEVLVGKTVEQALLEVMEEEELANLRAQQRAFEELRNAEHVEQQRLEEQERRHREEKVSLKLKICILILVYYFSKSFLSPILICTASLFIQRKLNTSSM